ncbi:DEAD/DEAH box helicase [Rubrivirga marina]|uniref:DEAD/DEAH box helicase n=1 Tax=Rubrivirga marina TaxID=1196024 RepID=UPI001C52A781|nr:DEAD/DEAH box helicase family protein [Rubrivirga marina]
MSSPARPLPPAPLQERPLALPGIQPRDGFALREGQRTFLERWAEALQSGERNALGVFVPGYGKTITALASYAVARALGICDRLVVFVPRGNLRDQYADADELAQVFHWLGAPPVSFCSADSDRVFLKNLDTEVVVTTYQYASGERGNEALVEYCRRAKALFVFDEVHHLADDGTWARAIEKFPHAASVALSGTPMRSDNKSLFGVPVTTDAEGFEYYEALHEVGMREAHAEGGILKRVDAHVVDYAVRMVRTDTGEEVEVSLAALRDDPEASRDVDAYLARRKLRFHEVYLDTLLRPAFERFAQKRGALARQMARSGSFSGYRDHQMLVIGMSNAHAAAILDFVRRQFPDVRSARIGQDVPAGERQELLDAYRRGQIDVMVQVDMIGEGTDIKPISVLVKADLVRAVGKTMQQVFRGMRYVPQWPEEANTCDLYAAEDSGVAETLRWIAAEEKLGTKTSKGGQGGGEGATVEPTDHSVWELKSVRQGNSQTLSLEQMPGYRSSADFHREVPQERPRPVAVDMAARERELRQACAELAKELSYAADVSVREVHAAWKRQVRGQAQADASVVELAKKMTWLERSLRAGRLL